MISDAFTNYTNTPGVSDVLCSFDIALGGFFIIPSLFLLFFVFVASAYSINKDILGSLVLGGVLIDFIAFIGSLIRTEACTPLVSFDWVLRFVVITALVYIAKKSLD